MNYIDPYGHAPVKDSAAQLIELLKIIASILWEQADWAIIGYDWLKNDFSEWDLLGLLPGLSHGHIRAGKEIFGLLKKVPEGFAKNLKQMKTSEIEKGIRSLEKRIKKHQDKIRWMKEELATRKK